MAVQAEHPTQEASRLTRTRAVSQAPPAALAEEQGREQGRVASPFSEAEARLEGAEPVGRSTPAGWS